MIRPVAPVSHTPRTPARAHRPPTDVSRDDTETAPASRAVAVIEPVARRNDMPVRAPVRRPDAAFLAHLLATQAGDPQTRTRRMAAPEDSAARYAESLLRPLIARVRSDNGVVL